MAKKEHEMMKKKEHHDGLHKAGHEHKFGKAKHKEGKAPHMKAQKGGY